MSHFVSLPRLTDIIFLYPHIRTLQLVYGAPECQSYTFNAEGKVTSFTGGYIMDRRVGNTKVSLKILGSHHDNWLLVLNLRTILSNKNFAKVM
jgi:hypothetical protein